MTVRLYRVCRKKEINYQTDVLFVAGLHMGVVGAGVESAGQVVHG